MAKGYKHLTTEQRWQIFSLKSIGATQKYIAEAINVDESTISREIKRNSNNKGQYHFLDAAFKSSCKRYKASSTPKKMSLNLTDKIDKYLNMQWSPEQISGRLKLEGESISHESIYQYIWKNKHNGGDLYKNLRRYGKKYKKRGSKKRTLIPNRIDISERPAIVDKKLRIGDWEGDTIVGKDRKGSILSYVDRVSKLVLLSKLAAQKAAQVVEKTTDRFSDIDSNYLHTVTYDNGAEFCSHEQISANTGIKCFFAKPYSSWERGLNEHTNGLVRQYFPKGTDFTKVTDCDIRKVEDLLNNRPRKVLGYKTPKEIFLRAG